MSKNTRFCFALLGLNAFVLVLRVLRSSLLSSTRSEICDQNRVSLFQKYLPRSYLRRPQSTITENMPYVHFPSNVLRSQIFNYLLC